MQNPSTVENCTNSTLNRYKIIVKKSFCKLTTCFAVVSFTLKSDKNYQQWAPVIRNQLPKQGKMSFAK